MPAALSCSPGEPWIGGTPTFSHEVGREVGLEEGPVLEGVVQLGVGHAAALEPAVEHLVDALQGRAPPLAGNGQVVDEVAVQVCRLHTGV